MKAKVKKLSIDEFLARYSSTGGEIFMSCSECPFDEGGDVEICECDKLAETGEARVSAYDCDDIQRILFEKYSFEKKIEELL